ncbi:hypothetical protein Dalk_4542 [Desulfatibacillum aliphaticivorans]|uniref:Uncharacterized protein n=2 Tax=Desulfatibacillum aliphaticivorans TaxID=218208 RepID=B8FCQ7_DESAL|nr:hypothetical protein Dalk_4542 [Desulfatibacillum aliphaticivorans]
MARECRDEFQKVDRRLAQGDVKLALQDQAIASVSAQVADIHKVVVSGNGKPPMGTRLSLLEEAIKRQWWAIAIVFTGMAMAWLKVLIGGP